jgi:hypothetical protein
MIIGRIARGRIVEEWDVDDRLHVMQQLGLVPPPAIPSVLAGEGEAGVVRTGAILVGFWLG